MNNFDAQRTRMIAHVVNRFGVGGLENGIVNLINRMPRERWLHAVISLTDVSPDFAARIERTDTRIIALGKKPGHLVREYPRLLHLFRGLRPAIVHTRNLAALEAVVPAWAARVPVRVHGEHGWDMHDPHGRRARYRLVRRIYRPFATRYIALSRDLEDYLRDQVGVPANRISQIYNGVDTDRFRPSPVSRAIIPDCPFGAPQSWLVGTVGRMEPVKDPLNLARAFIHARKQQPDTTRHWRLVMVGEGSLRPNVEALLERHGLSEDAWLPGDRKDVAEIMRGLDCFVLPSLAEGISNTVLEAMASALPVIATAVGGNGELIESGLSGTLVSAASSDALADAMLTYYHDHALARRHAKAARYVAERNFSLGRMVAEYVAVYERGLASAGIAPVPNAHRRPDANVAGANQITHPGS